MAGLNDLPTTLTRYVTEWLAPDDAVSLCLAGKQSHSSEVMRQQLRNAVEIVIDDSGSMSHDGNWDIAMDALEKLMHTWSNHLRVKITMMFEKSLEVSATVQKLKDDGFISKLRSHFPDGGSTPLVRTLLGREPDNVPRNTIIITDGGETEFKTFRSVRKEKLAYFDASGQKQSSTILKLTNEYNSLHPLDPIQKEGNDADAVSAVVRLMDVYGTSGRGNYSRIALYNPIDDGIHTIDLTAVKPGELDRKLSEFNKSVIPSDAGGAQHAFTTAELKQKKKTRRARFVLSRKAKIFSAWDIDESEKNPATNWQKQRGFDWKYLVNKPTNRGAVFTHCAVPTGAKMDKWEQESAATLPARKKMIEIIKAKPDLLRRLYSVVARRALTKHRKQLVAANKKSTGSGKRKKFPLPTELDIETFAKDTISVLYDPKVETDLLARSKYDEVYRGLTTEMKNALPNAFRVFSFQTPASQVFMVGNALPETVHSFILRNLTHNPLFVPTLRDQPLQPTSSSSIVLPQFSQPLRPASSSSTAVSSSSSTAVSSSSSTAVSSTSSPILHQDNQGEEEVVVTSVTYPPNSTRTRPRMREVVPFERKVKQRMSRSSLTNSRKDKGRFNSLLRVWLAHEFSAPPKPTSMEITLGGTTVKLKVDDHDVDSYIVFVQTWCDTLWEQSDKTSYSFDMELFIE